MNFSFKGYGKESARSYNQHEIGIRNIAVNIGENVKLQNMGLTKALNELSAQYLKGNIGANKEMMTDEMGVIDLLQRGEFIDVLLKCSDVNRLKLQEDLKTLMYQLKIVVGDLANMETNGGMLTQAVANGKMKQQTLDIIRAGSIQQTMITLTDAVVENEAVAQTMATIIGKSNMAMVKINNDILTNTNSNIESDIRRMFMKNNIMKIKGAPTSTGFGKAMDASATAPGYEGITGADAINNVQTAPPVNSGVWGIQSNPVNTGGWGTATTAWGGGATAQPANVNPTTTQQGGWGQPTNVNPVNTQPATGGWGQPTNVNPTTTQQCGWGAPPTNVNPVNTQPATGGWGAPPANVQQQQNNGGWYNQQQTPQPNNGWNDVIPYKSSINISDSSSKDDDYSFC